MRPDFGGQRVAQRQQPGDGVLIFVLRNDAFLISITFDLTAPGAPRSSTSRSAARPAAPPDPAP
jgi:hypothetical protein